MFSGPTWPCHASSNSQGVLATPFVKLFLHLLYFGWIKGPKASFTRSVPVFVLQLLKAFVQREIVPHRVLPSIRSCLNTEREWLNTTLVHWYWITALVLELLLTCWTDKFNISLSGWNEVRQNIRGFQSCDVCMKTWPLKRCNAIAIWYINKTNYVKKICFT